MLTYLTIASLLVSGAFYIALSIRLHRNAVALDDHLPLTSGRQARVMNSAEFSAATVATTISLATVILAYAELASFLGLWLLWTVITTAIGILVVRFVAPRIWRRLAQFGQGRPTLHGFLGYSFDSSLLMRSAAICTSLGFLGALAVELTVGSRFLAALAPGISSLVSVPLIAAIGVAYTMLGGFRAVVITDRVQMAAIWAAIAALFIAIYFIAQASGGISQTIGLLPKDIYDFSWREGLASFLVGIFIINVPTFLADMSIWQRIAATPSERIVTSGLWSSVFQAAASWSCLAILSVLLVGVVAPEEGVNPLFTFMRQIGTSGVPVLLSCFVVGVVGLYAASLSTASTQLIAAGHTLHTDLLRPQKTEGRSLDDPSELAFSRTLLLVTSVASVIVVWILTEAGFSIADLVFAVYGAQLGLVPVVLLALFVDRSALRNLAPWAAAAALVGFLSGWGSAAVGKIYGIGDLVFLAPAASLIASAAILGVGWIAAGRAR